MFEEIFAVKVAQCGVPRTAGRASRSGQGPECRQCQQLGSTIRNRTHCNVTYHDSLGSRADDTIKKYLPVSSTISLNCNEDGTVVLSDSSGRTFGISRGRWKYRHGMLLMDLKSDDGRTFTLGGTVNWRGDSFELHYDNSEFANMIRKSCEKQITDINAVLSSYVDDQLEVSISTKTPSFKIGHARCSPHVFSRQ